MNVSPSSRRRSTLLLVAILVVAAAAAVAGGSWYYWPRFESEPPQIAVEPAGDTVGVTPLEIRFTDKGTGLRSSR